MAGIVSHLELPESVRSASTEQLSNALEADREPMSAVEDRLRWCMDHPLVRVQSAVAPRAIAATVHREGKSPYTTFFVVHDVRVGDRRNRRRPDDKIYGENADLRERVPRGLTFVETRRLDREWEEDSTVSATDGVREALRLVIVGLRKFTGGLGDDDDTLPEDGESPAEGWTGNEWEQYFSAPLSEAEHCVATEKANGEAGHLAALEDPSRPGSYLWCAGSKNVHIVFRDAEDLKDPKYRHEPRYGFALPIAESLAQGLDRLGSEPSVMEGPSPSSPPTSSPSLLSSRRDDLARLLVEGRLTMCFEYLDPRHQHVESFPFQEPRITPITFASAQLDPPALMERGFNPVLSGSLARLFGFTPVETSVHSAEEWPVLVESTRRLDYHEGRVLFFLAGDGNTIGMQKVKSVWYIHCRAIREKARSLAMGMKTVGGKEYKKQLSQEWALWSPWPTPASLSRVSLADRRRSLSANLDTLRSRPAARRLSAMLPDLEGMLELPWEQVAAGNGGAGGEGREPQDREGDLRRALEMVWEGCLVKTRWQWLVRAADIQSWLRLPDARTAQWCRIGCHFLGWFQRESIRGSVSPDAVDNTFPVMWERFLDDSGMDDSTAQDKRLPSDREDDGV